MGLLERFKSLLGVDAPGIGAEVFNTVLRQGDTLKGRIRIEARTTPLELLTVHAHIGVRPAPAHGAPCYPDWGEYSARLDRKLAPGERLEQELLLLLQPNTPVPTGDLEVLLIVQVDVRGIPPPVVRKPLQVLPSVAMQAVIDSLSAGLDLPIQEVGASLESGEFALLYPDCTMVGFEATKETFARLGPAARSLEDMFLSNVDGGIKLYVFTPNAAERWQKALELIPEFMAAHQVAYQPDIEELSLFLPEDDIFAPDRTVRSERIREVVQQALRLVGGGTEKLV